MKIKENIPEKELKNSTLKKLIPSTTDNESIQKENSQKKEARSFQKRTKTYSQLKKIHTLNTVKLSKNFQKILQQQLSSALASKWIAILT